MRDLQRIQSCRMRALGIELEQEGTDRRIKVRQHRCKIKSFGSHHLPRLQCIWTDRRMPPRRDLHRAFQRREPERARSIRRQAELHAIHTVSSPAHTMFFRCDGQHGCRAGLAGHDLVIERGPWITVLRSQRITQPRYRTAYRRLDEAKNANRADCSCGAKQAHEWPIPSASNEHRHLRKPGTNPPFARYLQSAARAGIQHRSNHHDFRHR